MMMWLYEAWAALSGNADSRAAGPKGPQLTLLPVADDFFALHNVGAVQVSGIRIDRQRSSISILNADEPFDLAPDESWTFIVDDLGPWTDSGWQITLTCDGQSVPVCVPLAASAL